MFERQCVDEDNGQTAVPSFGIWEPPMDFYQVVSRQEA